MAKSWLSAAEAETGTEWCGWAEKLDIPVVTEGNYETVDMGATDALIAMKAGQIDGFAT